MEETGEQVYTKLLRQFSRPIAIQSDALANPIHKVEGAYRTGQSKLGRCTAGEIRAESKR